MTGQPRMFERRGGIFCTQPATAPVRSLWADSRLRSGSVSDDLRAAIPGQEFVNALGVVIRQAGQQVSEPSLRVDVVELRRGDEAVDRSRLIRAGEGPVSSSRGDRPWLAIGSIVLHAKPSFIKEADKCAPTAKAVIDCLGRIVVSGELGALFAQSRLQFDGQRAATLLADAQALPRSKTVDLTFDGEQDIDALDCLGRERRFAEPPEIEELAPAVCPTCARISPGKEEECDLKPFIVTQRVRRPAGKRGARQAKASFVWAMATSLMKRRQRVPKPCGKPPNHRRAEAFVVASGGSTGKPLWPSLPVRRGSPSRATVRDAPPGNLRDPFVST